MVKGISRQVIVVQSPDPRLFEQAIFILKDEAVQKGVSDEELLREARALLRPPENRLARWDCRPLWACLGAVFMGAVWLMTVLI